MNITIFDVPDDNIEHIFDYLTIQELIDKRLVCKEFKRIIDSMDFFRAIVSHYTIQNYEELEEYINDKTDKKNKHMDIFINANTSICGICQNVFHLLHTNNIYEYKKCNACDNIILKHLLLYPNLSHHFTNLEKSLKERYQLYSFFL